jgi:chromosome segregation ATPase
MSNLLKTLNKDQNNKFNPDVANLYNQVNEVRNTSKYNFSNQGYKTIMNDKIPKIVKSQEDLKVNYEKANEQQKNEILNKISQLENERNLEKERLNKQTDHTKKLEELIKIKRKENNNDNYQASTHGELKQIQINQNDKVRKEKEKFNSIVDSLNDILNK